MDIPADLRVWLAIHNGSEDNGPFLKPLLDTGGMIETTHRRRAAGDEHGVAETWQRDRVPFTADGAGGHLCLDARGTVVAFNVDEPTCKVVSSSLGQWLSQHAERLDKGELVIVDDDYFGVMGRSVLSSDAELAGLRILGESERAWRQRYQDAITRSVNSYALALFGILTTAGLTPGYPNDLQLQLRLADGISALWKPPAAPEAAPLMALLRQLLPPVDRDTLASCIRLVSEPDGQAELRQLLRHQR